MKNLISLIVTTKDEQDVIENLFKSIKKQSYNKFEIIVVDNNSKDQTKRISKKYTKFVYNFGPERSAQRNFGVKKAQGEFILIVDADMVLTKDVLKSCINKINKTQFEALVIPEKSYGEGFWSKCKAFEREFYLGDENIEAARFFKKKVFIKFRGYDTKMTGPEDWDLPLRMKKAGVNIGRIDNFIIHDEKKFSPIKSARKKFYYGLHAKEYLKKHPEMILTQGNLLFRPSFFKQITKMIENPFLTIGMIANRFLEMSGAALGIIVAVLKK